ncbi:peptidoglycan DD-metalloendopeptidase family protein [Rugamonas apoptosis]|uniref:Peptidoglycan DD-metalloendopeptidase family protein n=1 Tax=Rugamonas apoptosis TaxID=2758570 RepID=A0A7W2ILU6_9BURK|nr:peptidoglycan DD-metalloendopeptidase family protein [Rugamonas apoptosis]MBA5688998.1 peptidoglycan DD-metalloendopeptidase family protein [Rugamonas apoptosis]
MTNKSSLLVATLTLALLSACTTTPNQAPVVERMPGAPQSKPVTPSEEAQKERDERGLYTVRKGDTLIRIALEHGQSYRDIATWNNLANPDDIKVDQVLRVQPPDSAAVQTSAVAMPPDTKAPPAAPVPRKTGPKGDKRPYTDATLAELQKADGVAPERAERTEVALVKPASLPQPAAPAVPALGADDEKLSWMWPADGKVVASFDEGKNKGVDIAGRAGQQVVAAGAGKVMYAGSGIRGYGNLVIVKHSNSLLSAYAHNRSIVVKEGQSVNKGQVIAEMGDSDADAVKLHFEIRQQGKPVDPSKFLPNR